MVKASRLMAAVLAVVLLVLFVTAAFLLGRPRDGGKTGGSSASLHWPTSACLPREAVAACLRAARAVPGFGPVTDGERWALAEEAKRISAAHRVTVRADQLIAIRTMEASLAARTSGVRAQRAGEEIAAAVRQGESILAIAERLRLPPVAVLRQALLEEGHTADAVRRMLADPTSMPAGLAAQAPAVFAADLGSRPNADRIRAESQAYEDALTAHLRALGLKLRTEEDLRSAGSGPTPDALLDEPVRIEGRLVHWFDAKNYPMYGSRLVAKGNAKQARKYAEAFGPGAFVFSGGVMCGAQAGKNEDALFLDGSHVRS
jgi:hypothetical protein